MTKSKIQSQPFLMACCFLHFILSSEAFAQQASFKQELYDRGIKLLATQGPDMSTHLMENAFQAAASVNPDELLVPLASRYKLSGSDGIQLLLAVPAYSAEREFICQFLPRVAWNTDDDFLWIRSAYRLGKQNVELKPLLQDLFGSPSKGLRKGEGNTDNGPDFSDPRLSRFCFAYHLGQLDGSPAAKPLSFFQRYVGDSTCKTLLQAKYLATVGPQVFSLPDLATRVSEDLPESLQNRVLWQILRSLDERVLISNDGHEFIENYLKNYFDRIDDQLGGILEDDFALQELLHNFEEICPNPEPVVMIDLLIRAGWIQSPSEMLDVILRFNPEADAGSAKWLNQWLTVIMDRSLNAGNLQQAEAIAEKFEVPLPFASLVAYGVQNSDFEPVEAIVNSVQGTRKQRNVLAAVLLTENEPLRAKPLLVELEEIFHKKFNDVPGEKRLNWIVNQVMIMGWQNATPFSDQLPLEEPVIRAFGSLTEGTEAKRKALLNCLGSMTPPTKASKHLLIKLFKTLPPVIGEPPPFEIEQLCEDICQSDPQQRPALFLRANRLIDSLKKTNDGLVSELAFAFAIVGDQKSVGDLLDRIESDDEKIWALFQCAQAFPPRSANLLPLRYLPRDTGGFF